MSLQQLKHDLGILRGSSIRIEYVDSANPYGLSISNLAMITKDEDIFVLRTLAEDVKEQVEAHELGHLYLKYGGLVQVEYPFDFGFPGPQDYLALEINNAISHDWLIQLLQNQYGISSELHLSLRVNALDYIPEQILELRLDSDESFLHGIGVALYDMERTLPRYRDDIEDIASMDPVVNLTLKQARTHLQPLSHLMPPQQQIYHIQSFLGELGHSPQLFRFRFFNT